MFKKKILCKKRISRKHTYFSLLRKILRKLKPMNVSQEWIYYIFFCCYWYKNSKHRLLFFENAKCFYSLCCLWVICIYFCHFVFCFSKNKSLLFWNLISASNFQMGFEIYFQSDFTSKKLSAFFANSINWVFDKFGLLFLINRSYFIIYVIMVRFCHLPLITGSSQCYNC